MKPNKFENVDIVGYHMRYKFSFYVQTPCS